MSCLLGLLAGHWRSTPSLLPRRPSNASPRNTARYTTNSHTACSFNRACLTIVAAIVAARLVSLIRAADGGRRTAAGAAPLLALLALRPRVLDHVAALGCRRKVGQGRAFRGQVSEGQCRVGNSKGEADGEADRPSVAAAGDNSTCKRSCQVRGASQSLCPAKAAAAASYSNPPGAAARPGCLRFFLAPPACCLMALPASLAARRVGRDGPLSSPSSPSSSSPLLLSSSSSKSSCARDGEERRPRYKDGL